MSTLYYLSQEQADVAVPKATNRLAKDSEAALRVGYDTITIYTQPEPQLFNHVKGRIASHGLKLKVKGLSHCKRFIEQASVTYQNTEIRFTFHKMIFSISFEPASLFYSDNLPVAGIEEARSAILMITDLVQLPVECFRISRLDVTANFMIGEPLSFYTSRFLPPPSMKLQERYQSQDGTWNGNVMYAANPKNSDRSLTVYNKAGLMRIEVKHLKRLKHVLQNRFGHKNDALTMADEDFYNRISSYYINIVRKMCKKSARSVKSKPDLDSICRQLDNYELATDTNSPRIEETIC